MQFKYQLEPDLSEAEKEMVLLPNSRRNTLWRRELKAAGYSWEPSGYIIAKMNECILSLQDYRTFGETMPYSGGTRDQPAQWLRAMRCIIRAEAQAEQEKQAEKSRKKSSGSGTGGTTGGASGEDVAFGVG